MVYLEDVELPYGIAMRVTRIQSIFRYKYDSPEDFYEKLFSANNLYSFKSENTEETAVTEKASEIKGTKKHTKLFSVISIVSTVLYAVSSFCYFLFDTDDMTRAAMVCGIAFAAIAVAFGILAVYGFEKRSYQLLLTVFFLLPIALGLIPVFFAFGVAGLAFAAVLAVPAAVIILMKKKSSPADNRRNGGK